MNIRQLTMRTLLALALSLSLPALALDIAGITMPETLEANGTSLKLNGAGIRTKFMMKIYAGGLYLESTGGKAKDVIAADEPMAIRLHMVSGMVTSEAMEEATMEGFQNATGGNTAPLDDHIDAFMAVFREPITEGDVFDIVYLPGTGIDIAKNGTPKGVVDGGLEFKQAVFAIWLGKKPAHKGLKKGMLGN